MPHVIGVYRRFKIYNTNTLCVCISLGWSRVPQIHFFHLFFGSFAVAELSSPLHMNSCICHLRFSFAMCAALMALHYVVCAEYVECNFLLIMMMVCMDFQAHRQWPSGANLLPCRFNNKQRTSCAVHHCDENGQKRLYTFIEIHIHGAYVTISNDFPDANFLSHPPKWNVRNYVCTKENAFICFVCFFFFFLSASLNWWNFSVEAQMHNSVGYSRLHKVIAVNVEKWTKLARKLIELTKL